MENKIDMKSNNEDIDFNYVLNFYLRKKFIIGGITIIGTLLGIVYSYLKKPVYNGYFQIIVENQNAQSDLNSPSSLGNITNFISNKGNIFNKTQEAILKSPSVLKPVFENYKTNYSKLDPVLSKTSYQQWLMTYLNIKFEEGTNVLNINFKNKNKDAIISTLNEISSQYQNYSKRDRERSIKKGIKYLESQEKIFKSKSKESLKSLNKFSIDNGLGDIDGFVDLKDSISSNSIFNKNQLEKNNLTKGFTSNNLDNSGAGQRYENQFQLLSNYESQYTDLKSRLKPNSKILQRLENRIKNLKESLKRPNEILIEFRNLKRVAKRDETLLTDIENNLLALRLEQVRQQAPWELITEPTIDDIRLSPKRKQITIISFIFSFLIGTGLGYFKEKKDDLIYEQNDYFNFIPFKLIDICNIYEKELNSSIVKNFYFDDKNNVKKIGIINLSNSFLKNEKSNIFDYFPKDLNLEEIFFKEIKKANEFENILLIANSGTITFKNLMLIIRYLKTFKLKNIGWIFFK